jgi:hypothetical protein
MFFVVATACGSESSVAPNDTPRATLDQALTELTLPVLGASGGSVSGLFPGAPLLGIPRCAYSTASQSFVCPPVTTSGITINQSFTLLTATGATQSAFDQAATATVKSSTTVAGTIVQDGSTLSLDAREELTLSGLLDGPHTLNGTSTAHIFGTLALDGAAPIDIRITSSIANLVLPANTTAGTQVWPVSGTIIVESSAAFADFTSTSRVTMTFNGASTVTVTVTGDGISQTCQLDLSKPEATPACGSGSFSMSRLATPTSWRASR